MKGMIGDCESQVCGNKARAKLREGKIIMRLCEDERMGLY